MRRTSIGRVDPEDDKLVTLARAALSRSAGAAEGAAVRDDTGRTYAAASVTLGDLRLTALEAALAQAASSGVRRLEAAVVVAPAPGDRPTDRERSALDALGSPPLHVVEPAA